ncbi:MAG: type 4a pilus biogenesis protein PilO [Acidobacteria bacterium]|nr:type 4a pilus biogenesis protein PilO [Acidobacteriota bacterium]
MRAGDYATAGIRPVVRELWERPWWRLAGGFVVAAALLLVFQIAWASPRRAWLTMQERELAQVRAEQSAPPRAGTRLTEATGQSARLAHEITRLASAFPSRREAPVLLRQLHETAEQSTLTLVTYTPRTPEPVTVAGTELRGTRWSVQLELTGQFHHVAGFLERVGNLRQVVWVRDLAVRVADGDNLDGTVLATGTAETLAIDPSDPLVRATLRSQRATAVDTAAPPTSPPLWFDPGGRRDPFRPLPVSTPAPIREERAAGLPGIAASELSLHGIVVASGVSLAVLESPGGRSWLVRGGERLRDGVVGRIGTDVVDIQPSGAVAATGVPVRLLLGEPAFGADHEATNAGDGAASATAGPGDLDGYGNSQEPPGRAFR